MPSICDFFRYTLENMIVVLHKAVPAFYVVLFLGFYCDALYGVTPYIQNSSACLLLIRASVLIHQIACLYFPPALLSLSLFPTADTIIRILAFISIFSIFLTISTPSAVSVITQHPSSIDIVSSLFQYCHPLFPFHPTLHLGYLCTAQMTELSVRLCWAKNIHSTLVSVFASQKGLERSIRHPAIVLSVQPMAFIDRGVPNHAVSNMASVIAFFCTQTQKVYHCN